MTSKYTFPMTSKSQKKSIKHGNLSACPHPLFLHWIRHIYTHVLSTRSTSMYHTMHSILRLFFIPVLQWLRPQAALVASVSLLKWIEHCLELGQCTVSHYHLTPSDYWKWHYRWLVRVLHQTQFSQHRATTLVISGISVIVRIWAAAAMFCFCTDSNPNL